MLFLIQQNIWLLLLTCLFAGAAGWILQRILSAPKLRELEQERDRLRGELLSFASGERIGLRKASEDRELAFLRTRESIAGAKVAELDRTLTEVREQRDAHAGRAAELERALDRANAEAKASQSRADKLEAELARQRAEPNADEMNALRWRLRYFEARTRYLEGASRSTNADDAAFATLRRERDKAIAEAEALRAKAQQDATGEEANALKWRARYLEARVRHLESRPQVVAAAPDAEGEKRRVWRTRYLEARVRHLEERLAVPPAPPPANESANSKESSAGEGAGGSDSLFPETPPGSEVRPVAIAAPRDGAPDDLTLIEGMEARTESVLHALGVYHFDQIADWSRANVAWVDRYLRLRGRIARERWVEQARALTHGAPASRKLHYEAEMA